MELELLKSYLKQLFGQDARLKKIENNEMNMLPIYIRESYNYYSGRILGRHILLAELREQLELRISQITDQLKRLPENYGIVVLLLDEISAYNRNRLIHAGINFIVPGKQLFIPQMMMDLQERFPRAAKSHDQMLPSAQAILLYHIFPYDRKWNIEEYSFKEIAKEFGYTPMGITKAVENLKQLELIKVHAEKEKFIRFDLERSELWHEIIKRKLWINPVLKKVFLEHKPNEIRLRAGITGLSKYTEINESRQKVYAIERGRYYELQKNKELQETEDPEAAYCIEIWKYDPQLIASRAHPEKPAVDPLSLYLTLMDTEDERVEIELEKLINEYIW